MQWPFDVLIVTAPTERYAFCYAGLSHAYGVVNHTKGMLQDDATSGTTTVYTEILTQGIFFLRSALAYHKELETRLRPQVGPSVTLLSIHDPEAKRVGSGGGQHIFRV